MTLIEIPTPVQLFASREKNRLDLQAALDRAKTQLARNKLGQFATPSLLALDILRYAHTLLGDERVRFLDPAFGTGSFYSALLRVFEAAQIESADGFEVDQHYGTPSQELWNDTPLRLHLSDFTRAEPAEDGRRANLLICNPPYVRHHHLDKKDKQRLRVDAAKASGVLPAGLSGLYCYFLLLAHAWMEHGGLAGWLVPSEFLDVNYGTQIKKYLLERVTLLHIHRFDPNDVQFADALVSSAVIWFRKAAPPDNHAVEFSYGGTLVAPARSVTVPVEWLRQAKKWSAYLLADERKQPDLPHHEARPFFQGHSTQETFLPLPDDNSSLSELVDQKLGDLFSIKRGLATGANEFFIVTDEQAAAYELPREFLKPILPSAKDLRVDEVKAGSDGEPLLDKRRYLLDCNLPEHEIRARYPALWSYLELGVERGVSDGYLCRHRKPWYGQEQRPAAPLLCTYLGRQNTRHGRPFRFILNHSHATAPNVWLLLYPKPILSAALERDPELLREVWTALNAIDPEMLLGEGRVYGGGLHKLEPKELANASASLLVRLLA